MKRAKKPNAWDWAKTLTDAEVKEKLPVVSEAMMALLYQAIARNLALVWVTGPAEGVQAAVSGKRRKRVR